jgi:phosphocarrier protein HPr
MLTKTFTITSSIGLHARPAAVLVSLAGTFKSVITLKCKEKAVSLKSLISVLALGIESGNSVEISISGEDQTEAMARLEMFFTKELADM